MIDLENLVKLAKKNKEINEQRNRWNRPTVIRPRDFIDLINSEGNIIYLNKENYSLPFSIIYMHGAEYKGFAFKTLTRMKISNSDEEFDR